MGLDVSAIKTSWGSYYIDSGQGQKNISNKIFQPSETEQIFKKVTTNDTIIRHMKAGSTRVTQAWQQAWTPLGNNDFTPEEINLYKIKIDRQETPDVISDSYAAFLEGPGIDRKQWPIVRWMLEQTVEQHKEDMELTEWYAGVRVAPTAGTAGAAGAVVHGIKKIINDHIAASKISPFALGAVPTDPALMVAYVVDFCEMIPRPLLPYIKTINMSPTLAYRYRDGLELQNANYNRYNDVLMVKGFPIRVAAAQINGVELPGLRSHEGSTKIWATPYDNAILAVKKGQNEGIFQLETIDRTVKWFTDFWKGVGFLDPRYVFTNNVELPA